MSIGVINNKLRIRVAADCGDEIKTVQESYPNVKITYEDEWVLVLELEGDGET